MNVVLGTRGPSTRELLASLVQTDPVVSESSGRYSSQVYGSLYGWFRAGAAVAAGQNTIARQELAQFQPIIAGADDQPTKRAIRVQYLDDIASNWPPRLRALEQTLRTLNCGKEIDDASFRQAMRAVQALHGVAQRAASAAAAMRKQCVDVIFADVATPQALARARSV